ncbi:MAG: hypothetical protein QG583_713 [Patescibacteria group bacterium]|nr:hypothetical protein [Patescibacteria group bacterium]
MKKYLAGSLVLGVMVFGGMLPSKVNAGLSLAQQNSIITMLQNAGATAQAIAQVQAAFGMMSTSSAGTTNTTSTTSSTGGTTTTTTSSAGGTISPCTNNAAFNFTNGNPCSNYVPTALGGTTTTTTTTTTTNPVNPNAQYPYGTTPTTPNTPSTPSNCVSTQTFVAPYVVINGQHVQCVKACPVLTSTSMNTSYWNIMTTSMCPVYTPPPVIVSITVGHPNGGETFSPGETTGVKWESLNIPSTNTDVDVLLNYYDVNGTLVTTSVLADNEMNDGGVVVTLPSTLPAGAMWGNYFKVSLTSNGVTDMSDAKFTIE